MISFLITLLVVCVVVYVVHLLIDMLGLPPQVKTIAFIIVGLLVLAWILQSLGVWHSGVAFPVK